MDLAIWSFEEMMAQWVPCTDAANSVHRVQVSPIDSMEDALLYYVF